jgi:hypothetical protein
MSIPIPALQSVPAVDASASVPSVVSPLGVLILHTIDLPSDVMAVLDGYGKVVEYDATVEGALPIDKLVFDYLLLDIRKKADRAYFDKQDTNPFSTICYISPIEQFDSLIEDLNCNSVITQFPPRQHFKEDYNKLLLSTSTGSPSKCLSLLTFASNFFLSLKRKSLNSTP